MTKQSCKLHTDPTLTVAMGWLQFFFEGGSAELTLGQKFHRMSAMNVRQLTFRKFQLSISLQPFGNGTRKKNLRVWEL